MDSVLMLDSLTRSFGGKRVLNDLSFEIPQGRVFGFLGPNGSGKTTTMRIILGILTPDSGEVRYDGKRVTKADSKHFGYMPEERGLYQKMAVGEQLVYLGRLRGLSKRDARVKVTNWLERFGLAGQIASSVETLSLGNQQRVQLIAALLHEPQVLILDEPFSGLDPLATASMAEVMHDLVKTGRTLVFSSHQLDLVESICETVAIIADGSLVAYGDVAELTRSDDLEVEMVTSSDALQWISGVPGVQGISVADGRVRVQLASPRVSQELLRTALAQGSLREFAFRKKKLSEVFLQTVATRASSTSLDTKVGNTLLDLAAVANA